MTRQGQKQNGQFDVQPGMVFTMPRLEQIHPNGHRINAGEHPWLIVNTDDYYVEIVMCTTLESDKENKHRWNRLNYDNTTDITHPCPPMDRPEVRTSMVSLDTFMVLPKKELFFHTIKICNENTKERNFTTEKTKSLCLNQKDLKYIRKELMQYVNHNPQNNYDPYGCYAANDFFYDMQHGFTNPNKKTQQSYEKQFGWKHMKKAEKYAVYPFEDQMHDYEKDDYELLKIARLKKYGSKQRQPRPPQANQKSLKEGKGKQAENLLGHIKPKNPDDGLGYNK